jgi:hypothetical protein
MGTEIAIAIVTALVLIAVVGVRTYTDGKIEVKLTDAAIAIIAAGLMLFMTGRISKLGISSSGVTVETTREIILAASAQPIANQVSKVSSTALPVVNVDVALKGGVGDIPALVRREAPALEFVLGNNGYVGLAIQQYLETLVKYPFFRFVVILKNDKSLFGMIDGRKMLGILQDPNSELRFDTFARALNQGGAAEQAMLTKLPGFLPVSAAVTRSSDKTDALEKMEKVGSDWLPVVGENSKFDGLVERSRVTASLILDVTNQLRKTSPDK